LLGDGVLARVNVIEQPVGLGEVPGIESGDGLLLQAGNLWCIIAWSRKALPHDDDLPGSVEQCSNQTFGRNVILAERVQHGDGSPFGYPKVAAEFAQVVLCACERPLVVSPHCGDQPLYLGFVVAATKPCVADASAGGNRAVLRIAIRLTCRDSPRRHTRHQCYYEQESGRPHRYGSAAVMPQDTSPVTC
jgi:hypothetical protein